MKLKLKVQRDLVIAWKAEDSGDWVFSLCRRGFSELVGQPLHPGEEWLVEVDGHALQFLNPRNPKMASWNLNYGLNPKAKGSDKMKCNFTNKGGEGLQLVMGGAIPDSPVDVSSVIADIVPRLEGLDGLDANDVESHIKYLRTVEKFCGDLAAQLESLRPQE